MLGIKFIHVSERAPGVPVMESCCAFPCAFMQSDCVQVNFIFYITGIIVNNLNVNDPELFLPILFGH